MKTNTLDDLIMKQQRKLLKLKISEVITILNI